MSNTIDPDVRERALRHVLEHQHEFSSLTAACVSVAREEGIGLETVRRWVVQAQIDAGDRPGVTTDEREQIRLLKAENARLTVELAILEAAATYFTQTAPNAADAPEREGSASP